VREVKLSTAYTARTESQSFAFHLVAQYYAQFHCIPSCRMLARLANWKSHNAAAGQIKRMIATGLIVKQIGPDGRRVLSLAGVKTRNKTRNPLR